MLHKFFDDTTVTEIYGKGEVSNLQFHAVSLVDWSNNNHLVINVDKTLTCNISLATNRSYETPCVPITIGSKIVNQVNEFKLLGIWFSCYCKWNKHIDDIRTRANYRLIILSRLKRSGLSTVELLKYYK